MLRVLLMTDFAESYAHKLLQGILRYSNECTPCVVCKLPLSVKASGGLGKVLEFAVQWQADAIIGQFNTCDDVDIFRRNGIIAIAQDYRRRFIGISNITANYVSEGILCADYFINKGVKNFAFYGAKGMVWSDERKDGFVGRISDSVKNCTISVNECDESSDEWWYDMDSLRQWLQELPKPVAILACDDNHAFHIIEVSQQIGSRGPVIPNDIIVLGVDNDEELCQLCSPPLSSFRQQVEQAGYATAKMIDERVNMQPDDRFSNIQNIYVQPGHITVRRSSDVFFHDNPYIRQVCTYIQQNLEDNIRIDDIVKLVPMSRRLLEQLFRAEIGMSIYQYVIHLRVNKMINLLNDGKSPQEAAQEMCIDIKAFSRTFKTVTGQTLVEYSKRLTK